MNKHERTHLGTIRRILDDDECQCDTPPSEHPANHKQYCPVYLAAYLGAVLKKRKKPDPDSWRDAPKWCDECETGGGHQAGCCNKARKKASEP